MIYTMSEDPEHTEPELTLHVFTVSAAMVGVCLTGIGLFRVYGGAASAARIGDDLLAIDATLFALVSFLAFRSFRTRSPRNRRCLRTVADWLFLTALMVMVAVCLILTYGLV
jgi:hypothetical protein